MFRVHVDIPTVTVVVLLVVLFHRPVARWLFAGITWLDGKVELPGWFCSLTQNVVSDLIAAMIVAPAVVFFLRLRSKSESVGTFDAFDLCDDGEKPWGEVKLTYNITSNRIQGLLKNDGVEIMIEAALEKGQYLRGHYVESTNLAGRRLGAFLFTLSGSGAVYSGPYVYVDPNDENHTPRTGRAKWVRKK